MNKNKRIDVLMFVHSVNQPDSVPVIIFHDCKDVERDGSVLSFLDSDGVFHRTNASWEIQIYSGKE